MAPRFSIFSKKQGINFSVILNWQLFSRRVILQPVLCQKEGTHNTLFWLSIVGRLYVCVVGNVFVLLGECISCWKYVDITLCRFCRVRWQVLCQKEGPTRHSGLDSLPKSDGTLLWRIRFCRTKPKHLNICYNLTEM